MAGIGVVVVAIVLTAAGAAIAGEPAPAAPKEEKSAAETPSISSFANPRAAPGPGDAFRDCDQCPEMVVIPAGRFEMGSAESEEGRGPDEGPQHAVTIPRPFAIGKHEVTFAEWDACVAAEACRHRPADAGWGRGRQPVVNVSWQDAQEYVSWLKRKTGEDYRLPSEAEWEYAARAWSTACRPCGDDSDTQPDQANYAGSGTQWSGKRPAPAGSLNPNGFGLHDMIGNVWEWTGDCWSASYDGAPADGTPRETAGCAVRAVRGGSYSTPPEGARFANRDGDATGLRRSDLGFRVARSL